MFALFALVVMLSGYAVSLLFQGYHTFQDKTPQRYRQRVKMGLVTGASCQGLSGLQAMASSMRKGVDQEDSDSVIRGSVLGKRNGVIRKRGRSQESLLRPYQDRWRGVGELGEQVLITLYITILLIPRIILGLMLNGISLLDSRWTGNGFGLYDRTSRQDQEAWGSHSGLQECCDVDPEVILDKHSVSARNEAWDRRVRRSMHLELSSRGACKIWLRRRLKGESPARRKQQREERQERRVTVFCFQGMHSKASSLKRKSSSHNQGRAVSTSLALRKPLATSDDTPSSSSTSDSRKQYRSENPQKSQHSDPSSPSESSADMSSTILTDPVNPTNNITVLRAVIPTPASVGLTFDGRGATRWVDEVCAFFKDWNCTGEDRHERILRHVDIKLLDEVERANLFLYALPDRVRSKIVKKHNVDQDDGRTLMYSDFYKTAIGVCESDEVINRYKENRNPVMLSSKVSAVNNILRDLNTYKGTVPVKPEAQPPQAPALDRMFPTKFGSNAKTQDPRDDLARQLEELRIAQTNAIRDVREEIGQELRAALSQNNPGYNNRGYYQGRGGYGGFRGERGPGFNQRSYVPQYSQAPRDNQKPPANDTINASAVYGGFNGGGRYGSSGPNCYACYNIDRNGNPEQHPHGHSDRCSQLQELIQNGVCHKNSNGRLCLGPWREGAEEIMLRRDAPWVRQIVSRTKGTRYDPDVSRRAENAQMEQDQAEEAAQARANTNTTGANTIPVRSIIKRPDPPRIPVQHYSVVDKDGRDIDDLLNGRIHACSVGVDSESDAEEWAAVVVNAFQPRTKDKPKTSSNVVQSKVTKPSNWNEARKNKAELQKKAEAEAKLAGPKIRRQSTYVPDEPEESQEPDDMTIDKTIEVVPRPELSQDVNVVRSLEELDRISPDTVVGEEPRRIKLTAKHPKKSKGYRDLITQLGSGYPAEAVREKLLADLVQYRELFEVTDAARAALKSLIEGKPIVEEAVVNVQSAGLDGFATRGWIVATPKLSVNIMGPTDVALESAMLDTWAEANVMSYDLAKCLGCPILSTENLKLKTVSGQVLQFAGIAKADIEIEHGVGCTTVFFLVQETKGQTLPMVLLGQPFTRAMKMTFEHGDHSSIDAVFHDPRNHSTCTVSVVPPVKRLGRHKRHRQAYVEDASSEEEN